MNQDEDYNLLLESGFQPQEIPLAKLALTIFSLNEKGEWIKR